MRDVICQQSLALGELTNKPDRDCPLEKPNFKKACNAQPCLFSDTSNTGWIHLVDYFFMYLLKSCCDTFLVKVLKILLYTANIDFPMQNETFQQDFCSHYSILYLLLFLQS